MAKDPVCGMEVDPKAAAAKEHGGQTYFFCGDSCLKRFEADPARYSGK